jgi:hypothetical protein
MQEAYTQVRACAGLTRRSARGDHAGYELSPALIELMRNGLEEVMTGIFNAGDGRT